MVTISYRSASPCRLVLEAQVLFFGSLDPSTFLRDQHINTLHKYLLNGKRLYQGHTLVFL